MTDDQIRDGLLEILAEIAPTVDISDIRFDAPLTELGLDSLDISGLLLGIEEKFDFKISDEDAGALRSLRDFRSFLAANTSP